MTDPGTPTGFQLGLPEDWEIFDLVQPSIVYLGLTDAPFTLANSHWRLADIEQATDGKRLQARLRRNADGVPAEAQCAVSVYAVDVDNDPDQLVAVLAKGNDDTDHVALPVGTSIRRTGRRPSDGERPDRFVHQFFIPVPGTPNEIAFLEFWSPTFDAEGILRPHFEGIATSFEFTYGDTEIELGRSDRSETVMPDLRVARLARSAFAGWPGRFTPLAHLAVGTWLVAAAVIASRVVADAEKGFGAVFDDIFSGATIAFVGLVGYMFDHYHGRESHLVWLGLGAFFLWVAISCPEGRLGYIC